MKQIELTQGKYALVDDKYYDYLNKFSWRLFKSKNSLTGYAIANARKNGKLTTVKMHQLVWRLENKKQIPKGKNIDHRNQDGLDNQIENLRACTRRQNQQNRRSTKGTSKYKGVFKRKGDKKWSCQIRLYGRAVSLGRHETEIAAAKHYDENAKFYYGAYAKLNFKK